MQCKHLHYCRIRLISASCLVLIIILAYALLFSPSRALAANRVVDDSEVKVFVGSSRSTSVLKANNYINERKDYLGKLASKNAETVYSAVIILDKYYPAQDIEEFAKKENINVKRVYLWIPGETGRASLGVKDNDIKGAIKRSYDRSKSLEGTEEFGAADKDFIRVINSDYGIFSIVIESTASKLNELKDTGIFEFVDVKYSEEGEKAAADRGVNVQYIELSYKPDGAL